jgi:hypothetical protein
MNSNFNKDEIVEFERWNKKLKKNVITKFPVVGGRLRLYHEDLDPDRTGGGIETTIHSYENDTAVVQASVNLNGSRYSGIGMASKSRDSMIFPAILEMAETRAIARALRFAGYGVEYTGAEEMASVKNFEPDNRSDTEKPEVNPKNDPRSNESPVDEVANTTPKEEPGGDYAPDDEPLEHMKDIASPKRLVWEFIKEEYSADVGEKYLADNIAQFIDDAVEKGGEDADESKVFSAILNNKDRFMRAFENQIKPSSKKKDSKPEVKPEAKPDPAMKKEYEKKKSAATEKMSATKEDPSAKSTEETKLKAQIYMSLPDGVKVSALNDTLEALLSDNEGMAPADIYRIVLADMETFTKLLEERCAQDDVEPDTEEPVAEDVKPEPEKDEYSDFRKEWANLGWKPFVQFIIKKTDQFKSNKDEYDAAVAKFDRLKVKDGGNKDMCFPYMFNYSEDEEGKNLNTTKSVIPDIKNLQELSTLKQYKVSFPSMCKEIETDTGLSSETTDPEVAELLNDEVETRITDWEANNKRKYTED